jgi:formylglycine-generating enzyme required for sulfatase activity
VTLAQWDACVHAGACPRASGKGDNQPVTNVSRDEANLYVAWLSRMTSKDYRLLSEAEWECDARAGTATLYYWGDDFEKDNASCLECFGDKSDVARLEPVGSFKPNAFGLRRKISPGPGPLHRLPRREDAYALSLMSFR